MGNENPDNNLDHPTGNIDDPSMTERQSKHQSNERLPLEKPKASKKRKLKRKKTIDPPCSTWARKTSPPTIACY